MKQEEREQLFSNYLRLLAEYFQETEKGLSAVRGSPRPTPEFCEHAKRAQKLRNEALAIEGRLRLPLEPLSSSTVFALMLEMESGERASEFQTLWPQDLLPQNFDFERNVLRLITEIKPGERRIVVKDLETAFRIERSAGVALADDFFDYGRLTRKARQGRPAARRRVSDANDAPRNSTNET